MTVMVERKRDDINFTNASKRRFLEPSGYYRHVVGNLPQPQRGIAFKSVVYDRI